jgi:hypothetical protein
MTAGHLAIVVRFVPTIIDPLQTSAGFPLDPRRSIKRVVD